MFEGVFGASDEVLGVIERGVDIERRILEIVQSARNETEINAAFDQLQADLQAQISEQVLDARKRLLENVDEKVTRQLKTRDGEIRRHLSDFDRHLLLIARASSRKRASTRMTNVASTTKAIHTQRNGPLPTNGAGNFSA